MPPEQWNDATHAALLAALAAEHEPATLAMALTAAPEALLALAEAALDSAVPDVALRRIAQALGHLTSQREPALALLEELQDEAYDRDTRRWARRAGFRLTPAPAALAQAQALIEHPLHIWAWPLVQKLAAHRPAGAFAWLADCTERLIPLVQVDRPDVPLRYIRRLRTVRRVPAPPRITINQPDSRPAARRDLARWAALHLALDMRLLLGDPQSPISNSAMGRGVARLADEAPPLEQAEQRRQVVLALFQQRCEGAR